MRSVEDSFGRGWSPEKTQYSARRSMTTLSYGGENYKNPAPLVTVAAQLT